MKLIVAVIRPEMYPAVQSSLDKLGLCQMTLTEVYGRGHEPGHTMIYRGSRFQDMRQRRLRLEVAVEESDLDAAVETIATCAKTGRVGDGIIMVFGVEDFVRIRTGHCAKAPRQTRITSGQRKAATHNALQIA